MTRRAYIRSTDEAVMIEIKPRQYVNRKAAIALGFISERDKYVVMQ